MNLEQRMEKKLVRARPMAHLFPHTDLHIFTKKVLIMASFDAKLSTDGSHGNNALWEATC